MYAPTGTLVGLNVITLSLFYIKLESMLPASIEIVTWFPLGSIILGNVYVFYE